jgi:hypothetical protein
LSKICFGDPTDAIGRSDEPKRFVTPAKDLTPLSDPAAKPDESLRSRDAHHQRQGISYRKNARGQHLAAIISDRIFGISGSREYVKGFG